MNASEHDVDLAGAFVLNALDAEERSDFENHLAECAVCRSEVAELRQVVDVLPLACEPAIPSDAVWDRILTAVTEEPSKPRLVSLRGGQAGTRSRFYRPLTIWSAAAALVIAGLGIWNIRLQHGGNQPQTVAGAVVSHLTGNQGRVGTAELIQPSGNHTAYLVATGLRRLDRTHVYQLWLIKGSTPTSAGVFRGGPNREVVRVPLSSTGYKVVAVTIEPAPNGSVHPSSRPVLAGPIKA